MIFLIEYDRAQGTLVQMSSFPSSQSKAASDARLALEMERMSAGKEREIVILEAASEEQLRKTHRRYFESISSLAQSNLAGLKPT
jgi:hypothetical protein